MIRSFRRLSIPSNSPDPAENPHEKTMFSCGFSLEIDAPGRCLGTIQGTFQGTNRRL